MYSYMKITIFVVIWIVSCGVPVKSKKVQKAYDADDEDDGPPPTVDDIPDKYYDDLMKELPELGQILAEFTARRETAPYKDSILHMHKQPQDISLDQQSPTNTSMKSGRRIYQTYPYDYSSYEKQLEIWYADTYISKKILFQRKKTYPMASCYWCGMNVSYYIPTTSICHDAFETSDHRMRALQRFFRGKCYYTNPIFVNYGYNRNFKNMTYFGTWQGWNNLLYGAYDANRDQYKYRWNQEKWGVGFYWDYGMKRNFIGQYIGGCFKRHLDVGNIYTQRGCKHYHPIKAYGPSSVSHRFKKLEYVLRWKQEGCVSSTHASLTPFNRGISLYARYYVCVCNSRFCNRAVNSARLSNMLLAVVMLLTLIFNFYGYLIEINWKML